MHFFYRVALLAAFSLVIGTAFLSVPAPVHAQEPQPQQRVVEEVDILGNRRLRKDDILYWIQTRPGDTFSLAQVSAIFRRFSRWDSLTRLAREFTRKKRRAAACASFLKCESCPSFATFSLKD